VAPGTCPADRPNRPPRSDSDGNARRRIGRSSADAGAVPAASTSAKYSHRPPRPRFRRALLREPGHPARFIARAVCRLEGRYAPSIRPVSISCFVPEHPEPDHDRMPTAKDGIGATGGRTRGCIRARRRRRSRAVGEGGSPFLHGPELLAIGFPLGPRGRRSPNRLECPRGARVQRGSTRAPGARVPQLHERGRLYCGAIRYCNGRGADSRRSSWRWRLRRAGSPSARRELAGPSSEFSTRRPSVRSDG
jgi:hypothetical protein